VLAAGGLVAFPTETVYGLGADATNDKAVAKLYAVKERPAFNPLIAHVADLAATTRLAVFDDAALHLARAFWPGPLTLVLPKTAHCPVGLLATAGLDTIAVRVPSHPVAREILAAFAKPVVAPSANRSGTVSPTTAQHVLHDLRDRIDLLVNDGPAPLGIESTIVACLDGPVLLRPGAIDRDAIEKVLGFAVAAPARAASRRADKSILDWITGEVAGLRRQLSPTDRARLNEYLDDVREIERRIQQVEAHNASGEARQLPEAPIGVPDAFDEHVKLMFDLQAVAFASDVTRVFSFKMGRDGSSRAYPESGVKTGFHPASHHQEKDDRIADFAKINRYHVSMVPYFLEKLKNTPDGDGTLLDHTLVLYGWPMGDSNVHNHKRCPLFLAGHAGGKLPGNLHIRAADGTPMANAMLHILHVLGLEDKKSFGDSSGALDLASAPQTTL